DQLSECTLTSNYIQAMTIDHAGHLWFSSRFDHALSMFDGTHWTKFDSVLHGNYVIALAADSSGNIWIGTGNGLVKFDGSHSEWFDLNKIDSFSNVIYSLLWDNARHTLWIGNG